MKILAIRGKNLASLTGHFEVDFQQEPLASSGLYAICGPTGAGKSTLLDALCLSLYDNTPRLIRAGTQGVELPDVQNHTVSPRDPRNLLSRGHAVAYAETDFLGNDGLMYRARWSVRRALGQNDGNLQKSEMKLWQLPNPDERGIGHTKTEVKAAIEARLGLSFSQFTRAVLLAQNEFAAFLKADDNERAELLQTLTGTDTFTDISQQAFQRYRLEQSQLQAMNQEMSGFNPLNTEQRLQLEQELSALEEQARTLNAELERLESQLQWHEKRQATEERKQQAAQQLDVARSEKTASVDRRTYLHEVEAVQTARPLLDDCLREREAATQATEELEQLRQRMATATEARDQALAAVSLHQQQVEQIQSEQKAASPSIEAARALDHALINLKQRESERAQNHTEAQRQAQQATHQLTEAEQQLADSQQAFTATTEWLHQHEALESLASGWPRWDALLQQAETSWQSLQAAEADGKPLQAHVEQCAAAQAQIRTGRIDAEQRLAEAEHELAGIVLPMTHEDMERTLQERKRWELQREQLKSAQAHWEKRRLCVDSLRQQEGQSAALDSEWLEIQEVLRRIETEWPATRAALEQAERSLRIAELTATQTAQELSRHLRPGEACPVCGSLDHPGHPEPAHLDTLTQALQQEVERLRGKQNALSQEKSSQETMAHLNQKQRDERIIQVETQNRILRQLDESWLSHEANALLTDIPDDSKEAWCSETLAELQQRLKKLESEERTWRRLLGQQETARQNRDERFKQVASIREAEMAANRDLERVQDAFQGFRTQQAEELKRLESGLAPLDAVIGDPDWRIAWKQDPKTYRASLSGKVDTYKAKCNERIRLESEIATLNAAIELHRQAQTLADQRLQLARSQWQEAQTALHQTEAERKTLLDGQSVSAYEQHLNQIREQAEQTLARAEQERQEAETTSTREQALAETAATTLSTKQQALKTAEQRLYGWLEQQSEKPLDVPQLTRLLQHDHDWLKNERSFVKTLDENLAGAEAIHQDCLTQAEQLESTRPGPETASQLQEKKQAQGQQRDTLQTQQTELAFNLRQDDERRLHRAKLLERLHQQEARLHLWGQLNELIGSADGRKFRNYAQQLTLDVLLGYANRHLENLARRYRLERVQDKLALMVVDQDMGDEMRSVHSLSGGETFLVSLALALGLASLSSHRVQVESLFIDEGFGSLDPDTLHVAMNALDCLHAQGRKVGIISHVRELTERIGTRIQVRRLTGGHSQIRVEN